MLSRDAILNKAPQFPREEVQVPEWGGSVMVRCLSGAERDKLEVEWESTKRVNFRARLVAYAACDDQGKPLFLTNDIPSLGQQPASALSRICDVAFKLNAFTKSDVEELEKNSGTDPSAASNSALRRVLA
jgi:hypothetical protein